MEQIRVTLRRSPHGASPRQRLTVRALGLRRIRQTRELPRRPAILGMIEKIKHLVSVDD